MPNSASTVPPFIPGLLIVSLLIIISLIIGWRNYSQRGNPRLIGMGEWAFWEVGGNGGRQGVTNSVERPKMWEVDIVERPASEKNGINDGWEKIMVSAAYSPFKIVNTATYFGHAGACFPWPIATRCHVFNPRASTVSGC